MPNVVPTLENMYIPTIILDFCDYHQGIVLVTGATGTGKSTTLAAMVDHLNKNRSLNIISLEDPIEFVHPRKSCTFNQRELCNDFGRFANGLRAALRPAPKVILVGEMRDRETHGDRRIGW